MHSKILLSLLVAVCSMSAMDELVKIDNDSMLCSLDNVKLFHDDHGFYVLEGNEQHEVKQVDVDPLLKKLISKKALARYLSQNYIRVNKLKNGDFKLVGKTRGLGGGIFGANAGFLAGKFVISFLGHGTIMVVSSFAGPAAPAAALALESTFGPFIEAASVTVGLGCGVAAGVATGPV